MSNAARSKRTRSTAACVNCHNRKVRCSVRVTGVPCPNCVLDGANCRIYGQTPPISTSRRAIRPRNTFSARQETERRSTTAYPPTPSTTSPQVADDFYDIHNRLRRCSGSPLVHQSPSWNAAPYDRRPRLESDHHHASANVDGELSGIRQLQTGAAQETFTPFYAGMVEPFPSCSDTQAIVLGESEGLEFTFDVCYPGRAEKGPHYMIKPQRHHREHQRPRESIPSATQYASPAMFRLYFHYVHPFYPILNARDVLSVVSRPENMSPMLLFGMLFAAASFADIDTLKEVGFTSRKSMKQFCYQRAKEIYDSQVETDKSTCIQVALLLAFWYVDHEDLDGSWYWNGVALSLAHGIGLHRDAIRMSPSRRSLYRRLWWCIYSRETWLALGFGLPLRISSDDCDVPMPSVADVWNEVKELPSTITDSFIPTGVGHLAQLWTTFLHLSVKLEHVLTLHYKVRRAQVSLPQLQQDDEEIMKLHDSIPCDTEVDSSSWVLHSLCLRCYCNAIVIAQYRPYMTNTPDYLTAAQQAQLQSKAIQRAKATALDTTSILHRLVSLALIDVAPGLIVLCTMSAIQVHLYEHQHSTDHARQYAYHHISFYMTLLTQLGKTYWMADLQHSMFQECLRALEVARSKKAPQQTPAINVPASEISSSTGRLGPPDCEVSHTQVPCSATLDHQSFAPVDSFDDLFMSINPFVHMLPSDFGTQMDWGMGVPAPVDLGVADSIQ